MGNALPEHLLFAIAQATHCFAHTIREHIVDCFDHFTAGAEIGAEQHLSALAGSRFLRRNVSMVFIQKNTRICQPELIDGLLHVANHKAIVSSIGQCLKNRILYAVGVLILIHHNFPEPASDLTGRSSNMVSALSPEEIQHFVLQIAEIHTPAAFLGLGICFIKSMNQSDQASGSPSRSIQVRKNL